MPRSLLLLTLLAALLGTALLAYTYVVGGSAARTEREESLLDEPTRPRGPRPPPDEPERAKASKTQKHAVGTRVSVLVVDAEGAPIENVLIEATLLDATSVQNVLTDTEGRASLHLSPHVWRFDALAVGFLPEGGFQRIPEPGDLPFEVRFRLIPAASLTGRVFDDSGTPVPMVLLYLLPPEHTMLDGPDSRNSTVSREGGLYVFPGVEEGIYDLGARADGFLPVVVQDIAVGKSGRITRDVVLKRGRKVQVRVRNASEDSQVLGSDHRLRGMLLPPGGTEALAGALVGRSLAKLPVVRSPLDEEGACVLSGLSASLLDIVAVDPQKITEPGLGSIEEFEGGTVELELLDSRLLKLEVVDAITGKPVAVTMRYHLEGSNKSFQVKMVAEGLGAIVPTDPVRRRLTFEAEGYETAERETPAQPDLGLRVEMLPATQGATGSFLLVFDPPLGGGTRLALVGRDETGRQRWVKHVDSPDEEQRWRIAQLPEGVYSVVVLATGKIPGKLDRLVVNRSLEETHRLSLSDGGGLAMRVTDEAGKLLDKVHIELKDAAGSRIDLHILSEVSDGRGFLSVNYLPSAASATADSGLAPGAYTLTAFRQDFVPATEGFTVRGTETAEVTVTLRPSR